MATGGNIAVLLETDAVASSPIVQSPITEPALKQSPAPGRSGQDITESEEASTLVETNRKPRAILHVGVGKTGTSSIQSLYKSFGATFAKDNYYWVPVKAFRLRFKISTEKEKKYAQEVFQTTKFVESLEEHAKQGHNVFISNEHLAAIPLSNRETVRMLTQALAPFNTTVVVGYRRFFEWWLSVYRFNAKGLTRKFRGLPSFAAKLEHDMTDASTRALPLDPEEPFGGPPPSITHPTQRIIQIYQDMGFEHLSIFNMHEDERGVVPGFYCKYMGESSHTCQRTLQEGDIRANSATSGFENDRVAWGFVMWIEEVKSVRGSFDRKTKNAVANAITRATEKQSHNLKTSNTTYQFPKQCLSSSLATEFLRFSLAMEQALLPAYNDKDEVVHTERFWSFQKQGKFCNVDVDKVVNDASWQAFITKTISGILTLNVTT